MSWPQRTLVSIATLLAVGALCLGLTSLLQERWLSISVNGIYASANDNYQYHSRAQGLIWVCLHDSNANVLKTQQQNVVYGRCFTEQLGMSMPSNATANDWYIVCLHRTQLGLKSASIFINVIGLLLGFATLLQWCLNSKTGSNLYRRCRGIIIGAWIFSALLDLSSLAIYHYYMSLEMSLKTSNLLYYYNWPQALKQATTITLDIMYFFEWGTICLLVFAALLFVMSLCLFPEQHHGSGSSRGINDDRTYLYHSNPMMQMSSESLPPYDANKSGPGNAGGNHHDDGHSARSGHSSRRLPRYPTDGAYQDNQAKNVYRIY